MWMIPVFFSKLLDTLFPPSCYNCHKHGKSFCQTCLAICRKSLHTPAPYITSIYSFKEPVIKRAIHSIKYFHRRDIIHPLTEDLAKELIATIQKLPTASWIFIPIPMPPLRKYMRGYNQAELIARELSQQCTLPINTKLLARSHSPKRQVTTRTRSERLSNQHHTFKITGNVEGLHIILVDDVTTTGATLSEARALLLQAGASKVLAVTLAH